MHTIQKRFVTGRNLSERRHLLPLILALASVLVVVLIFLLGRFGYTAIF